MRHAMGLSLIPIQIPICNKGVKSPISSYLLLDFLILSTLFLTSPFLTSAFYSGDKFFSRAIFLNQNSLHIALNASFPDTSHLDILSLMIVTFETVRAIRRLDPFTVQTGVSNYPTACHLPAIASSGESGGWDQIPDPSDLKNNRGCVRSFGPGFSPANRHRNG